MKYLVLVAVILALLLCLQKGCRGIGEKFFERMDERRQERQERWNKWREDRHERWNHFKEDHDGERDHRFFRRFRWREDDETVEIDQ